MKQHGRSDEYISDYCDAAVFKSHPLYHHHKDALQLITYFDEVEVCNPLGAQKGIHKTGELRRDFRAIPLQGPINIVFRVTRTFIDKRSPSLFFSELLCMYVLQCIVSIVYGFISFTAGMFYYMIGNIRPELRSTHRCIQLIACVTSRNIEKWGGLSLF